MNWLAHLVLAESQAAFRVGSVLADILPLDELRALPAGFQAGIAQHRAIDSFTDRHPLFRQSIARLPPPFRRYGGIIMDVYYDHLLTVHWPEHCSVALPQFVAGFHDDVELCRAELPAGATAILDRMRLGGWLVAYGDLDGVRLTLNRIARRLRRPFDLGAATRELARQHTLLEQDFATFFPEIRSRFGHLG